MAKTEAEKSKGEKTKPKDAKTVREKDAGVKDGQPEPDVGVHASPVSFVPMDDLELPAFYDSPQQTIFIKTGLSEE